MSTSTRSFDTSVKYGDARVSRDHGREGGARFTTEQKQIASSFVYPCSDEIDRIWFEMFENVQKETGLDDEGTYLLIQKVRGDWGLGRG